MKIFDLAEARNEQLPPKSVACATHGEYQSTGQRVVLGKLRKEIWSRCPGCVEDERRVERERKIADAEARNRARLEEMLGQTMIPARFLGKTFDTYRCSTPEQEVALQICRGFAQSFDSALKAGSCLVLSGKPGTGKSHLAGAILQAILPRHVGLYVTVMDLIRSVRDTWRRESSVSESEILSRLTALPLLVIDEIGVQYGTDGERAVLFDIMDRRYRDMRPTILMTNLEKAGFKAAIGDRVYDRLTEVAKWVPFEWQSYRATARKEGRDAAA